MIIYFYLFIPLVCRLTESSSIKGRNHKNDLVPFLSSRLDTQKDNSLKIVSNEPFIIQFQMPQQSSENVHNGAKLKDKRKKRPDKKRVSKIKPLRKKIRKRRDVLEVEKREEKPDQPKNPVTEEKIQSDQNKTQNSISRLEILKALNSHGKKKETKKLKPEGVKNLQDVEKTNSTSNRNLHRSHSSTLPDRDPHVKMIYPNTPKSESPNYSYKDLIADRERLEQKINYIRNLLNANDTTEDDAVRVRRRSDSDKTANKIAKMFLTLSAVNGLHDKRSKCRDDDDDRVHDIWEKERKKSPSRQSSSSNEERYKVKKWIEYMKSKRSSGKTCPCIGYEYNEENDIFPLEQKLAKGYQLAETGTSSEESSDNYKDPPSYSRGILSKSGLNRNGYKEDTRSKLRALANRGRRKYELPVDDLEIYRSRARQILQNAEEILDKIKEEEEKRLASPHALVSRLRELTSRIQGDPRNNENDLIKIIQKNLGWSPQSKSQSSTDNNSFIENMKSFILDPYEKAKALTDESTRKLSSYLLRNLGKIDSSDEQEEATGKSDQSPQIYHGQVPQTEEMFSANLAKENPSSDLLAKEREEQQNWSDTLSAMFGGNDEDVKKGNSEDEPSKQIKDQEDSIKRRMEEMIKEQEKQISEYTEKPERNENVGEEESTVINLMTDEQNVTPQENKPEEAERVAEMSRSEKEDEIVEKSDVGVVSQDGAAGMESETVKSTPEEIGSDVIASEHLQPSEDQTVPEELAESVRENVHNEDENDKVRVNLPVELQDIKAAVGEDSPKEAETVAEYLEDKKDLESPKANENQEGDAKDVVMQPAAEFHDGVSEEKDKALESPQELQEQDDKVKGKQEREENDVLNSKHLVLEGPEKNEDEELEELTEDIQKLLEENAKEHPEETTRKDNSAEREGTVMKKEYDSSERKEPEEGAGEVRLATDSVRLEKPTENASGESQDELSSDSKPSETGIVQASQDPEESLEYDSSKKDKASNEKANSAERFVESEMPENSAESEKTEDSAEGIVEKSEKERSDDDNLETEREDDTLKSALGDGEVKEDDEATRKELDSQNDNQDKEILRETVDDAEQGEAEQLEPSLKASLDESENEQKSSEIPLQKSLEETEDENLDGESPLRSENPENENLEKISGEMSIKASEQSEEENEVEEENEQTSLTALKSDTDEIQDTSDERNLKATETELDNRENEDEAQVRAELTEDEESPLRSENPEKDTERLNENLMNTSGSQENVEAAEDETQTVENSEIQNEETEENLKATATRNENIEEIGSTEEENVEKQRVREDVENSSEVNEDESMEVNKTPKLVMSIKESLGKEEETMKANQEEVSEENDGVVGETLNTSEQDDDVGNTNINEDVPLRAANPETDRGNSEEVQDTQEINNDDINVRAENTKDLDNQIDDDSLKDGLLRSTNAESDRVNEDATLSGVNSLERKNLNENDMVEGANQMKESEEPQITVGKKKNVPVSEEIQNSAPSQSKSTLKVPQSIGKIMRDLSGKEKDDYTSLTNLNPEKIDHIIDKIDEAEQQNQMESEGVDCRKECACADEMYTRSRNTGRYEIVKDFLHWVKDLQLNRVLNDD